MNKNNGQSSVTIVVIAVVVVLVVAFGAWFYFNQNASVPNPAGSNTLSANQNQPADTGSSTKTTSTSGTTTPSNTPGFTKYSNKVYAFSFEYPQSYTVADGKPNSAGTPGNWFVWVQDKNQETIFAVNVFQSAVALDEFVRQDKAQISNTQGLSNVTVGKNTYVGGMFAEELNYTYSGKNNGTAQIFYVKKGGMVYRIQLNQGSSDPVAKRSFRRLRLTRT